MARASLSRPLIVVASLLVATVHLALAGPTALRSSYAVKDYHRAPRGWANMGPAPAEHMVDLSIGLTQGRFTELERQLYEVSDPEHSRYGQHLSQSEVHELIKPKDEALQAVHEWLRAHGITSDDLKYSPAKDWIRVALPISSIESLLDTEYSVWEHSDGFTMARTESFSLPRHLHEHISTIQPTNSWARLQPHKKIMELERRSVQYLEAPDALPDIPLPTNSTIAALCNFTAVTPACLRTLYGTLSYEPKLLDGSNKMGLTNYLEEYNNRSDAAIFLQKYRPDAVPGAYEFTYVQIDNGTVDDGTNHADDGSGLEGNLDVEYMLGIAYPVPLTAYSTGGRNPTFMPSLSTPDNSDEPFLTWANFVLEQPPEDVPQIISTSYGDDEQTMSRSYAQAVCNQFAQLGARGVSLLFASGDFGVGANDSCYSNADNSTFMFLPSFPNSCPYVTNVGGTYKYPEQAVFAVLRSGLIFASGGGFSNYFDVPEYQAAVVSEYVGKLNGEYDGFYNKSGRAYPDISCVGQRFPTIWNGSTVALVGTSGSTPICSAVLTLANDALLAAGRPPLGFLNPWLYKGGFNAFTDVTNGSAYGCMTDGFPAVEGWDAVTGWGTPYLPSILKELNL